MRNIYFILSLILVISACGKEDLRDLNAIDLSELKAGQSAEFHRYITSCTNLSGDFMFTGDTLILEVVNENEELFFKEHLTENSPLFQSGSFQEPIFYPVRNIDNGVLIPDRWSSALFFFYGNDTLRINTNPNVNLVQKECKMMQEGDPFIGNDIGFINIFQIGPVVYRNKTAVSCVPMADVDAYLIHDDNKLYGSHVIIFDLFSENPEQVSGWKMKE